MGSGVTPNHASSVIQTPSSYFSHILNRWNQYLLALDDALYVAESILLLQVSGKLVYAQPLVDSILIWRIAHLAPNVLNQMAFTVPDSLNLESRLIRTMQKL
jgi:hypothetical protein